MGKRNKEPQVGRRRPMIQLGGGSQKSGIGVVSRNAIKEEEKGNKNKECIPDEMEDQLAGFLAEINSLDDGSSSSTTAAVAPDVKKESSNGKVNAPAHSYDSETFDPATQGHLLPENWQAIYDEGSAYYYYWNTVSNEVQWFPPAPPLVEALPPPPPPPPIAAEEDLPREILTVPGPPESNGFTNHGENSKLKSTKSLERLPMENHIDVKVGSLETIIRYNSPDPSETCIKEDDIIVSYSFTPEKVNDRQYVALETEKPLTNEREIIKRSDKFIDKYAELENSPLVSSKPLDRPSKVNSKNSDTIDPYSITEPFIEKPVKIVTAIEKPVKIVTPIEKPVKIVTPIEKPVKMVTHTEKSAKIVAPIEKPVKLVTPIEKPVKVVTHAEKPAKIVTHTEKPAKIVTHAEKPVNIVTHTEKLVKIVTPMEKPKIMSEESNIKDKDKELMSKIKEKIQRKKEEKLRKEKEETSLKLKEEDLFQLQKSKEEMLREKLIKKKYEREKALTSQEINVTDESNENLPANINSKKEDLFSVDMFASEEIYEKAVVSSPTTPTKSRNETPVQKPVVKDEEPKKDEKKSDLPPKGVIDENSTKERGGWRIIDAVYDEDDDEDEEESDNAEPEEPQVEEVIEKDKGEMDDYAEMLLEETIVDKDKDKPRIKSKKKKSRLPFVPALPLEAPPPPPPEPENPPLPLEDEPAPQPPPEAPAEEDSNVKEEINSASSTILEKMNVLGISRGEIGKLQQCLIELETRMQDWIAGALESKYFLARLKEVDIEVLKHETAPAGWISHWSSNFKMYYYYNTTTGTSQWDDPTIIQPLQPVVQTLQPSFPDYQFQTQSVPQELAVLSTENESGEVDLSPSVFTAPPPPPPPEATPQVTLSASAASLVSPAHGFSRDPLPEKTTKSRKRTVQENEKSSDPYRDPYRLSKKKKEAQGAQGVSDSITEEGLQTSGSESGTGSPLPPSVIASGPVLRDAIPEVLQDATLQSYVTMTPPPPPPPGETVESIPSPKADSPVQPPVKTKVKKKKKVEGLAPLKKLKHVSTLVQKWQTVKQQVEDEENVEEESDEDYEAASERRINEWKKEMEYSESKNYNANFEEIKGDWRERLKRKTAT